MLPAGQRIEYKYVILEEQVGKQPQHAALGCLALVTSKRRTQVVWVAVLLSRQCCALAIGTTIVKLPQP